MEKKLVIWTNSEWEDDEFDLECERDNLDVELGEDIVVLADLGLWDGRRKAYKEITSKNIKDCLYDNSDYLTWYVDGLGDMRCEATHHDGTNRYLYRVWKEGVNYSRRANFLQKYLNGKATRRDVTRYTSSVGKEVMKVYGVA